MFKDYKVVEHFESDTFQSRCREMLTKGWIPQGGVNVVIRDNGSKHFAQAFVLPA